MSKCFIRYVIVSAIALVALSLPFMATADIIYSFVAVDSITGTNIRNAKCQVFEPGDSVLVAESHASTPFSGNSLILKQRVIVNIPPKEDARYNFFIDARGYDTRVISVDVSAKDDNRSISLGEIALLKTPKQLDEVTVTATKIKMYYKGDTVVYNADAFMMPDGSMLTELIRKLDGVTYDEQGQMFHNGRKIESMLLSGRDLFNGQTKSLIRNLGAYTADKIKIYEQTTDRSKFLGYDENADKPLVMDIHLKKEYSFGKIISANGGYGTDNRYLGRGYFGIYNDTFALSAFGNANNLSDNRDPGRIDFWSMENTGASESSYLSGGIMYQYETLDKKRKINGKVDAHSSDTDIRSGYERTNYLPSGNTFDNSFSTNRNTAFSVSTDHTLNLIEKQWMLSLSPRFYYQRNKGDATTISATFNNDPGSISASDIEAIFSGDNEHIRSLLINRNMLGSNSHSSVLTGSLNSNVDYRLPDKGAFRHNVNIHATGNYGQSKFNTISHQWLSVGNESIRTLNRRTYSDIDPTHNYSVQASAAYSANFKNRSTLSVSYSFSHESQFNTNNRYLIETVNSDLALESIKFGAMQPDNELLNSIDPENSYRSDYVSNRHNLNFSTDMNWGNKYVDDENARGLLQFSATASLQLLDRKYDYRKIDYDTIASRFNALPSGHISIGYSRESYKQRQSMSANVSWRSEPQLFSMSDVINSSNTVDPLNIFRGNPDLRNSYNHTASASLNFRKNTALYHNHSLNLSYSFIHDYITRGMVYNTLTGVRTQSMYNVDGHRTFRATYSSNGRLKESKKSSNFSLGYSATLSYVYSRSVGMIASITTNETATPDRQFMYSHFLRPQLGISSLFGKNHSIGVSSNASLRHFSGNDFNSFNTAEIDYIIHASFSLPLNLSIASNLDIHTRRGYTDARLNTDSYILNGSISWYWKQTGLKFTLDGYDLLHQIKSITYTIDPYGRTESWNNILPRYAMLRISFHKFLSPKKKSEEY